MPVSTLRLPRNATVRALALTAVAATLSILPTAGAQAACGDPPRPGVNWDGCVISGANLTRVNLAGASLVGTIFRSVNLSRANFAQANLRGARFERANMTRSNLSGADARNTLWVAVNLTRANLRRTNFTGARYSAVNARKADFSNAIWTTGQTCRIGSIGFCVR